MRREQRDGQLKCWTEKTNRYSPHWSMRSWWKVCIPWELKSERRHNMIAGTFRTKHVIKVVSLGLWLQSGSTLLSKIHTMKCWKAKQLDWSVQSVKEKQTNKVQVSLELTLIVSSSVWTVEHLFNYWTNGKRASWRSKWRKVVWFYYMQHIYFFLSPRSCFHHTHFK